LYGQAISLNLRLGKYDEARAQFNKAIELNRESWDLKYHLARIDYLTGNYEKALEFWQEQQLNPDTESTPLLRIAYIHALSGKKDKAEEILQKLIMDDSSGEDCYSIALVYTALGDRDNAFIWLEKAYKLKGFSYFIYLKADPEWDSLHSDPRFKELTDKIGIP
jgi:tetratricopeptide (TPR) repeat protein